MKTFPIEWELASFEQSLLRITKNAESTKSNNYKYFGSIPVIDQGQNQIAGYIDDESKRNKCPKNGLIVFGDHTRIVKFINHDFVLGADGTQLLEARDGFDSKFLFYLLSSKEIPNTGYNRHFKFLKEITFAKPSEVEQRAIAEALSDIDELISISKNELEKRHNIALGVIGQIIDGSYFQSRSINCEFQTIKDLGIKVEKGALITEKTARPGKIPVIAGGFKPAYYHDEPNRTGTTITVSASGANAGFVNIWREEIWASDCSTISESSEYDVRYIYYVLLGLQKEVYKSQYGGAQPHVRPNEIYNLVIPWIKLDDQQVISKILEDAFLEIQIMENQILKYEWLKQGMMNDLLTGKVRLV
jgi:restriction endonuclease S subunit